MNDLQPAWNGIEGTAGGPAFGAALAELAREREVTFERLGEATGLGEPLVRAIVEGTRRVGVSALAALALALRARPIEFLQKMGILGLEAYAFGLDPLYFLPEGPIRYDARIYMREINPRHAVPEADMTRRNPTLDVLSRDEVLDQLGKVEVEIAYLLRAAVQVTGGTL